MASENSTNSPRSGTPSSSSLDPTTAEPLPAVKDAIAKLADAQANLAATIRERKDQPLAADSIELLLNDAQTAAQQIVERAELEALTIRRLMRIEAERLTESV